MEQTSSGQDLQPQLARRSFLKLLGATAGATVMAGFIDCESAAADTNSPEDSLPSKNPVPSPAAIPEQKAAKPAVNKKPEIEQTYGNTIKQTLAVYAANALISAGSTLFGFKLGNAATYNATKTPLEKIVTEKKLARLTVPEISTALAAITIGFPAMEEGIFRLSPSLVGDAIGLKGDVWPLGIATSAAFAATHGTKNKAGETVLPVPQFLVGMSCWRLQRRGNFSHALLSHGINNGLSAGKLPVKYVLARRAHGSDTVDASPKSYEVPKYYPPARRKTPPLPVSELDWFQINRILQEEDLQRDDK